MDSPFLDKRIILENEEDTFSIDGECELVDLKN